ncbi:MAG: 4Fe-4S dicluster domain-containing protein [bacterium]
MTPSGAKKRKRIYAREEVCIGCRLCEVYCITEHSESKDVIKAFRRERPRQLARVVVEERRPLSFALQCRHCEEPLCVYSCISGAMYLDEEGAVRHNEEMCVGCWTCIMVCPYGAIRRDEAGRKVASKCDLCPGRETPACVENCPNRALVYE